MHIFGRVCTPIVLGPEGLLWSYIIAKGLIFLSGWSAGNLACHLSLDVYPEL